MVKNGFFNDLFTKRGTTTLKLPLSLRNEFKEPAGQLFKPVSGKSAEILVLEAIRYSSSPTITVGDVCTRTLANVGFFPSVAIVDRKTMREEDTGIIFPDHDPHAVIHVENPSARVTYEAVKAIERALILNTELKKVIVVRIEGEEDLLVLPAVILAPNGSNVIYGQPGEGIVLIKVDTAVKRYFAGLLINFK